MVEFDDYETRLAGVDQTEYLYQDLEAKWRAEGYTGLELPDDVYGSRSLMLQEFQPSWFDWHHYVKLPRFTLAKIDTLHADFLAAALDWVDAMKSEPTNLVFIGANGVGKTHSAMAACRFMSLHGVMRSADNLYIPKTVMLRCVEAHNILDGWNKDQDVIGQIRRMKSAELLFIDDVGAVATSSQSAISNIVDIIAHRYDVQLPTVITSNMGTADLERMYGTTVMRRLFDTGTILHIAK